MPFFISIAGKYVVSPPNLITDKIQKLFPSLAVELIGEIDTINYLKQYNNEYLFVCGVGQVVLESLSLGFPTAVSSIEKNNGLTFISKNNIQDIAFYNFARTQISSTVLEDLDAIIDGNIDNFQLHNIIKEQFNIYNKVEWYKNNYLL